MARYLYLCCVANWCTNQFFRLFGITLPETRVELRGESYVADTCISQFCALYGLDSDEIESGLITAIDEVFSQRDNLTGLKTLKPGWPIAEKLRDYLLFLALVENEGRRVFGSGGPNANAAVIFVSRRHASPYGDLAAAVIDSELVELADSRTRSATFYGAGGDPFRPALKAQMWLADSIWSVIPEQDVEVGEDLTWIYLEAEHATVSGKPSFCIARNMKDLEDAMPRLRAVTKPMLADNVRKARDQIREDTLDRIERQITIISPDRETLEDLIHDPLRRVLEESSRERRRTLLRAILRLFEPDDRAVFRVAFDLTDYVFTKAAIEKVASGIRFRKANAIRNAFDNAKDRAKRYVVSINGKEFHVFKTVHRNSTRYQLGLLGIARELAGSPTVSDEVLKADIRFALADHRS
ncbi:hypothetical protein [Brevundimonas diminuta]|uniref:hypothetical protein n=1 Tax=Brevundimonas diminuta TaxID=293 RepID=UPI003F7FC31D